VTNMDITMDQDHSKPAINFDNFLH
jgi:hypothetical protein